MICLDPSESEQMRTDGSDIEVLERIGNIYFVSIRDEIGMSVVDYHWLDKQRDKNKSIEFKY